MSVQQGPVHGAEQVGGPRHKHSKATCLRCERLQAGQSSVLGGAGNFSPEGRARRARLAGVHTSGGAVPRKCAGPRPHNAGCPRLNLRDLLGKQSDSSVVQCRSHLVQVHRTCNRRSLPAPTGPPGRCTLAASSHVLCLDQYAQQLLKLVQVKLIIVVIVIIYSWLPPGRRVHLAAARHTSQVSGKVSGGKPAHTRPQTQGLYAVAHCCSIQPKAPSCSHLGRSWLACAPARP